MHSTIYNNTSNKQNGGSMHSSHKFFWIISFLVVNNLFLFAQSNQEKAGTELLKYEKEYEEISRKAGLDNWNYYSQNKAVETKEFREAYSKFFFSEDLKKLITHLIEDEKIQNDTLKRRVAIMADMITAGRVNFDSEIVKKESQLEEWLAMPDTINEKPDISIINDSVIELVKLRNKKAQEAGYLNYPDMVLETTGLGSKWFYDFVDKVEEKTSAKYQKIVEELTGGNKTITFGEMRQGLIGYYMSTAGVELKEGEGIHLLNKTLNDIGYPGKFNVVIEEKDLPPGVGGQGIAVSIPDDFRIVVPHEYQFSDLMHEIGHGMQWSNIDVQYPSLKAYEWCMGSECSAISEGLAEVFSKIVNSDSWKRSNKESIVFDEVKQVEANKYLPLFLRFHLASFLFEHELYKNPDKEPKEIYDELYKKYLFISEPVGRYRPLANIIYVAYPLYMHNYTLADIVSWQILESVKNKFGEDYSHNKEVFNFLKEKLYMDGTYLPWEERLQRATDKMLDLDGYFTAHGL